MLHNFNPFLQRVSLACYAKRCISGSTTVGRATFR